MLSRSPTPYLDVRTLSSDFDFDLATPSDSNSFDDLALAASGDEGALTSSGLPHPQGRTSRLLQRHARTRTVSFTTNNSRRSTHNSVDCEKYALLQQVSALQQESTAILNSNAYMRPGQSVSPRKSCGALVTNFKDSSGDDLASSTPYASNPRTLLLPAFSGAVPRERFSEVDGTAQARPPSCNTSAISCSSKPDTETPASHTASFPSASCSNTVLNNPSSSTPVSKLSKTPLTVMKSRHMMRLTRFIPYLDIRAHQTLKTRPDVQTLQLQSTLPYHASHPQVHGSQAPPTVPVPVESGRKYHVSERRKTISPAHPKRKILSTEDEPEDRAEDVVLQALPRPVKQSNTTTADDSDIGRDICAGDAQNVARNFTPSASATKLHKTVPRDHPMRTIPATSTTGCVVRISSLHRHGLVTEDNVTNLSHDGALGSIAASHEPQSQPAIAGKRRKTQLQSDRTTERNLKKQRTSGGSVRLKELSDKTKTAGATKGKSRKKSTQPAATAGRLSNGACCFVLSTPS